MKYFMAKQLKVTLPPILAFSRKLEVSDALMTSGLWSDIGKSQLWKPIKLHEKRNRATHSQYNAKVDDRRKPNLSWGDDAVLPHDADTLRIQFSLKIMGQLATPTACNDQKFEEKLKKAINAYNNEYKFRVLAFRYATNIANGRYLWRNKLEAETVQIHVKYKDDIWSFDALNPTLRGFDHSSCDGGLSSLTEVIKNGLIGESFEYIRLVPEPVHAFNTAL